MTGQNEDPKEALRTKFEGPNRDRRGAPPNPTLGHKLVDLKEKAKDAKISSVLNRVFWIEVSNHDKISRGAAFALDVQNKRYLVTASHVIKDTGEDNFIFIFQNKNWTRLKVKVVGKGDASKPEDDIAVLAADIRLPVADDIPFNASVVDIFWGQHVYFCGFPHGLHTDVDIAEGHPIAMTKGAVLSGMYTDSGTSSERERGLFILDGINNVGFSGGPAVFQSEENRSNDFQVFGVVRGSLRQKVKIKRNDKEIDDLTGEENTGLIHCPSIMRAVDMIEAKPIGFEISRSIK